MKLHDICTLSSFAHAKNNTVHLGLKGKFGVIGVHHIENQFFCTIIRLPNF